MAPTRRGRPPAALSLDLRPGTSSPTPSALPPERPHIQRSPTRAAPHPAQPHPGGPTTSAAPPGRPHNQRSPTRAAPQARPGESKGSVGSLCRAPHFDATPPCATPRRNRPLPHTPRQHPSAPHLDAAPLCPTPRRNGPLPHTPRQHPSAPHLDAAPLCPTPRRNGPLPHTPTQRRLRRGPLGGANAGPGPRPECVGPRNVRYVVRELDQRPPPPQGAGSAALAEL